MYSAQFHLSLDLQNFSRIMLAYLPFQLVSLAQCDLLHEVQMMLILPNLVQVLIFFLSNMSPFLVEDQRLERALLNFLPIA
jgi:hypothetical protein